MTEQHSHHNGTGPPDQANGHQHGGMTSYLKLAIALVLSFVVMYFLTFAMINVLGDFFLNIGNLYMALMMVFPMGIIMIVIMWKMFPNKALNTGLLIGFVALFFAAFFMGRAEAFIGNDQFLRSMIPHHSRAILVCEQSDITDPEITTLCEQIVSSQQQEIDQMKQILERLNAD
ncbi:hypothetical protein GCM10007269_19110 [Microbacterium murale]|uniref:DUF305 domain-containing protein n=2 Tax=Microbacterium murale TaxID=1081040 RepID=A0ABQ1RNW9_9MICO|nr:hypothetical protein GCM10007269_19110 [Microbacterium murale]